MYNISENPQVIYSLDMLSDTLFNLLMHHSIKDITITKLCEEAMLTRKTFYRNCENIYDLIIYKIDKLILKIQNSTDWNSSDEVKLFTNFFDYWYNNRKFLSILNKHNLFYLFITQFNLIIQNSNYPFLEQILNKEENKNDLKLFYNAFLVGGLSHVLEQWTKNNFEIDIKYLVKAMSTLTPQH